MTLHGQTGRPRERVIEDVRELIELGESNPYAVAARMGMSLDAIARSCYRSAHPELARPFSAAQKRDRPRRRAARAEAGLVAA